MTIETKFDCDMVLFFMKKNKISEQSPVEIKWEYTHKNVQSNKGSISYRFKDNENLNFWIPEWQLFKTKEELLASL